MKRFYLLLLALYCLSAFAQNQQGPVIIAYAMSRGDVPDPTYITHINYAFGHVNETFNGVMINRPQNPNAARPNDNVVRETSEDRLRAIVALKKQKPELKVLLSIGGWGSGRFSEMAANDNHRRAFVADCKRVLDEFDLDGIDLDWEYPTSSSSGISSSPSDMDNFTKLMREIREVIGRDKLLTFASAANARYVDFRAIEPIVDFVNIMTYDMGMPPYHHSALYPSEHARNSCEQSIDRHIAAGIPAEKLVLGMPFYGKGEPRINIHDIASHTDYTEQWDDVAKVPYLTNAAGEYVYTYENPRSLALKCEYLKKRGLLGAMYWQYSGDDAAGTYRKTVWYGVMTEPVVSAYVMRGPIPDPTYVTHINYAFGHVNETFNGIRINSEERLMDISNLKKQKPSLKVVLSIGGWGSGRFSEMAADNNYRRAFVADCKRVVEQFNLDGIDLDWEYPSQNAGGRISASPNDIDNFTRLMREIREILGPNKILSFASVSTAEYVDFKAVEPYVDFVNIMTYDMGTPPYHHSALYPSEHTRISCEESVNAHMAAGIPPYKIVLGVPFYGKGSANNIKFWQVRDQTEFREQWDDVAKVPYLTNAEGEFVYTYENPRSLALKCDYLKNRGLRGAMYWEYSQDDYLGTMQKAVYGGVMYK